MIVRSDDGVEGYALGGCVPRPCPARAPARRGRPAADRDRARGLRDRRLPPRPARGPPRSPSGISSADRSTCRAGSSSGVARSGCAPTRRACEPVEARRARPSAASRSAAPASCAVKLRFHRDDWREDVAMVAAVREAVGSDFQIMVDANHGWRMPGDLASPMGHRHGGAVRPRARTCSASTGSRSRCGTDDRRAYLALRAPDPIRIAAGEMCSTAAEARDLIVRGAVDVIQTDVVLAAGGISGCRRVAALAELHGRTRSPHTWSNGFSLVANLHLALAVSSCPFVEVPYDPPVTPRPERRDWLLPAPVAIDDDGSIAPPAGPGPRRRARFRRARALAGREDPRRRAPRAGLVRSRSRSSSSTSRRLTRSWSRVAAAGVCHSDLHLADGALGQGTVADGARPRGCGRRRGASASGVTHVAPGDRVAFSFVPSCGACRSSAVPGGATSASRPGAPRSGHADGRDVAAACARRRRGPARPDHRLFRGAHGGRRRERGAARRRRSPCGRRRCSAAVSSPAQAPSVTPRGVQIGDQLCRDRVRRRGAPGRRGRAPRGRLPTIVAVDRDLGASRAGPRARRERCRRRPRLGIPRPAVRELVPGGVDRRDRGRRSARARSGWRGMSSAPAGRRSSSGSGRIGVEVALPAIEFLSRSRSGAAITVCRRRGRAAAPGGARRDGAADARRRDQPYRRTSTASRRRSSGCGAGEGARTGVIVDPELARARARLNQEWAGRPRLTRTWRARGRGRARRRPRGPGARGRSRSSAAARRARGSRVRPMRGRPTGRRSPRAAEPGLALAARAGLELARLLERVDPDLRVAADRERHAGGAVAERGQVAVAEVALRGRAADTVQPRSASSAMSPEDTWMPWTTLVRGPRKPQRSSSSIGVQPCSAAHSSSSRRCSQACTCRTRSCRSAYSPMASIQLAGTARTLWTATPTRTPGALAPSRSATRRARGMPRRRRRRSAAGPRPAGGRGRPSPCGGTRPGAARSRAPLRRPPRRGRSPSRSGRRRATVRLMVDVVELADDP